MNDKLIKGTVIDLRTPEEFSKGHYPNDELLKKLKFYICGYKNCFFLYY